MGEDDKIRHRPTVRIACVDDAGAILLGAWHDYVDDSVLWELPGGGIEEDEDASAAARRELAEETSLQVALEDSGVLIARDVWWLGWRYIALEPLFIARGIVHQAISTASLLEDETSTFLRYAWVGPESIGELSGRLENPDLIEVLASAGLERWQAWLHRAKR